MTTHNLKIWPEFFKALVAGEKTYDIRKNDRTGGFQVGDTIFFLEWDSKNERYTGHKIETKITHVLHGGTHPPATDGLKAGYVALSFREEGE